mmetsp:Transcript_2036/g.7282  ORF Transcript_2036/g.7282 Transcript_2036/m.7282 type:complete len:214 (-) Transcript_2036:999-1640(-)
MCPGGAAEEGPPRGFAEAFVVCGLSTEIVAISGESGFSGVSTRYKADFLETVVAFGSSFQCPPQLPVCCLPSGVDIASEESLQDASERHVKNYPIVLTGGDGSKVYVACLSFYDPVPPASASASRPASRTSAPCRRCLRSSTVPTPARTGSCTRSPPPCSTSSTRCPARQATTRRCCLQWRRGRSACARWARAGASSQISPFSPLRSRLTQGR